MLAEFTRPDDPDEVIGRATWDGASVNIDAKDEGVRDALGRVFRPSAVLVDSAHLRSFGASGPELMAPGSLRWFIAAAESRSVAEGLAARLTPDTHGTMGWDPAGAYRSFAASVERREHT